MAMDINSPPGQMKEGIDPALTRILALGVWAGNTSVRRLKGGLSNESWVVTDDAGSHVVRFGVDYPFHHVSRDREVMIARAAAEVGLAPELEHAGPGFIVTRFLEARTLAPRDVQADIARIARLIREFHEVMPRHVSGPGFYFSPFHVIRDYARSLAASASEVVADMPRYLALADALEAVQVPLPIVFGHNDLLPANILECDGRLWLIDFEYAGFSTALFDLAGISSNASFTDDETELLLATYFGTLPDRNLRRATLAMQCASLLREAMWGMVSDLYLDTPGVDYGAYARENLGRLDAILARYQSTYGAL